MFNTGNYNQREKDSVQKTGFNLISAWKKLCGAEHRETEGRTVGQCADRQTPFLISCLTGGGYVVQGTERHRDSRLESSEGSWLNRKGR